MKEVVAEEMPSEFVTIINGVSYTVTEDLNFAVDLYNKENNCSKELSDFTVINKQRLSEILNGG